MEPSASGSFRLWTLRRSWQKPTWLSLQLVSHYVEWEQAQVWEQHQAEQLKSPSVTSILKLANISSGVVETEEPFEQVAEGPAFGSTGGEVHVRVTPRLLGVVKNAINQGPTSNLRTSFQI